MNSSPDALSLDPEAGRLLGRVRRIMVISLACTFLAVAGVLGVVGYRIYHAEPVAVPTDFSVAVPEGARIVSVALTETRIALTLELSGRTEVRLFDTRTLQPRGRLTLASNP